MITHKPLQHRTASAVALASVVCLLGTAAAPAADVRDVNVKVKVNYSDLNLGTINGATTLYQRIEGAARFVCGEQGRRFDEQRYWKSCYGNAVNHAVSEINNPLLTSLYRKQYGAAPVTAMLAR